ncbi:hypothetical protein [Clostridium hydrogenum]|nr:hypothetical protein [Clostridium hydrogenum]
MKRSILNLQGLLDKLDAGLAGPQTFNWLVFCAFVPKTINEIVVK